MHGEHNATADAGASPNANAIAIASAGASAEVAQDMNGKHQKRKHTMIPIDDSFFNNNSDADGDYVEGGEKAKCGKKAV